MPAALAVIVAWVAHQMESDIEASAWHQVKSLVAGDPGVNALAKALHDSIIRTAEIVAKNQSRDPLRQGMINAFADYNLDDISSDTGSLLAELRHSIDYTMRNSALASKVPGGTLTQLEDFAPGVDVERLVAHVTHGFVKNINRMGTKSGSSLTNLSQQLNADAIQEQLQSLQDIVKKGDDKVTVLTELVSALLLSPSESDLGSERNLVSTRITPMFEALKLIHSDYLTSFAQAEKLLGDGVGSIELLAFLETRRAGLVADRLEEISRAEKMLTNQPEDQASEFAVFARAVLAYFDASDSPARITYFTDLLTYTRGLLRMAQDSQHDGPVNIRGFFATTTDGGNALLRELEGTRKQLQWRFEDVARAFAAVEP